MSFIQFDNVFNECGNESPNANNNEYEYGSDEENDGEFQFNERRYNIKFFNDYQLPLDLPPIKMVEEFSSTPTSTIAASPPTIDHDIDRDFMAMKIVMSKIEPDSILQPIQEGDSIESLNNVPTMAAAITAQGTVPPSTTASAATNPPFISIPAITITESTNHESSTLPPSPSPLPLPSPSPSLLPSLWRSSAASADGKPHNDLNYSKYNSHSNANNKRYSIPASVLPTTRKLSVGNLAQPLHNLWDKTTGEYQRRKSIPALMRFERRESSNYSSNTGRRYTQNCNLYPKDFFWNMEGKAPKFNTKMQHKVDAVGRVTGEWGRWQLRAVLLIFLCKIPSAWFMACIIFTAPAPKHGEFFCKPPQTIGIKNQTLWIKISHPQKEEADDHEFNIDFCNIYKDAQEHAHLYYKYANPADEPRVWEQPSAVGGKVDIIPCQEFQHQTDYHSIITQYDLVCSRDILVSVTQFFHLFGVLTGGILAFYLLKHFSPRNVMLFGMITQIFCGNLTGYVNSYELHVVFRCLSAVCCAQMYTAGGMIMADITGGTYRIYVSTLFEQFWSIGVILLPGVASFFNRWNDLYMAISWPTIILIYLWQWIPDSPRWMILHGRVLEAKKILIECAEMNGTRFSLPYDIDQQLQRQAETAMDTPTNVKWLSLWKDKRNVRHIICVHLCWSIYIVIYYGMLLNIRSFSRDHLSVNTVIAGLAEMMGTFIGLYLILSTTRKWLWTGLFNIVAGFIAYLSWLVPVENEVSIDNRVALLMLTAMISKMAISCTLAILTTCTVELVSVEKRKICGFSVICWARFCLLGAPFIGATVVFGQLIPQSVFATLAIIGGLLSTLITSSRTIPKRKKSNNNGATASKMATATQIHADDIHGVDNKIFVTPVFNNIEHLEIHQNVLTNSSYLPHTTPQKRLSIWKTENFKNASQS